MMKIFDRFTVKKFHFVVKEENLIETMSMVDLAQSSGYFTEDMSVSNCGLDEIEPNLWSIKVSMSNYQWYELLKECKDKKYKLIIKDEPNKMYVTKI